MTDDQHRREQIPIMCGDHAFSAIPHPAAVDLIAAMGFDGIKIVFFQGESHHRSDDARKDIHQWAGVIEERVRSRGLKVLGITCVADDPGLLINHPSDGVRAEYRRFAADMIELADRIGSPRMLLAAGSNWATESHDESLERLARELIPLNAAALDRGVTLAVEPHVGTACETPTDALRLLDRVPELHLEVDYSQFVCQEIAETDADVLLPYASAVHARGAVPGRLQAPLRESTIDYDRIVTQLLAIGFDGPIGIEFFVDSPPDGIDVLTETAALRDLLRAASSEHSALH